MGILVSVALLLVLTIGVVGIYWLFTKPSSSSSFSSEEVLDVVKKHPVGDANSYKRIAFFSGLFISLLFVTFMIEYETEIKEIIQQNTFVEDFEEIMEQIPQTEMPPPPPPKIVAPEIIEIPDEEILTEKPPEIIIPEGEPEEVEVVIEEEDEEEAIEEIVIIAEEKASFPGGIKAMYEHISSNFTYQQRDIDAEVTGIVYVKFVIEKDGSISNLSIPKGLNDRLNKEALRVTKLMPRWKPGRNGGRPVRMWFQLPIRLVAK